MLNGNEIAVWLRWCFCSICWFISENRSLVKRLWSGLLQISAGVREKVLLCRKPIMKVLCMQENYHCNHAHCGRDVSMSLLLRHFDVNIWLLVNIFCEQNTLSVTVLNNAAVLSYCFLSLLLVLSFNLILFPNNKTNNSPVWIKPCLFYWENCRIPAGAGCWVCSFTLWFWSNSTHNDADPSLPQWRAC